MVINTPQPIQNRVIVACRFMCAIVIVCPVVENVLCVVLYFAFVVEKFKSNPLMVEAFSRIPEVILPLFRVIPRTDWHNFNSAYFSAV